MDSTLTETQRIFLEAFFSSGGTGTHFYLSGGTGLSGFYLHHRYSEDIDLFTMDPAQIPRIRGILQDSLEACGLEVTERREGEEMLEYKVRGDPHPTHPLRKIDVVRDTQPVFSPPEFHGVVRVDSLLNIAVNKVAAIFSRSYELKDYVDLFFILQVRPFDLDALLPLAAQKDLGFDELRFAASLAGMSNLRGLHSFLEQFMVKPVSGDDLIRFCREAAARIFDRYPPRR